MPSVLTKSQAKQFSYTNKHTKSISEPLIYLVANVRYDDECNNGHNTFAITGEIRVAGHSTFGRIHDDIAKYIPELAPYIKWHLCSPDAPLHYVENAMYWAGHRGWCDAKPGSPPNLDCLKSTVIYGVLPEFDKGIESFFQNEHSLQRWLDARLPRLLEEFEAAVVSLGFAY